MRYILIGCSKLKIPTPTRAVRAEDLYCSDLFKKRRRYAERQCELSPDTSWFILSAYYGMINPWVPIKDYDHTIMEKSKLSRAAWHLTVALSVCNEPDDNDSLPKNIHVEIHAGKHYSHPLAEMLVKFGFNVTTPCDGMEIGELLHEYKYGMWSAEPEDWGPLFPRIQTA